MEKIVRGVYRSGEIILLDETELHEGEIIKVKLVGRKELVDKLAGVLGRESQRTSKDTLRRCTMRVLLDTNVLYNFLFETPSRKALKVFCLSLTNSTLAL